METRGGTNDGNETGVRAKTRAVAKMRTGTRIGTGTGMRAGFGGAAKKRTKSNKRCRRDEGNGEHVSGKGKKHRQKRVGSVTADPGLKKELYKSSGFVPSVASDQRFL